jgi:7-cyano-7-deazaguanine synthase
MASCVALISGGPDSAALAYWAAQRYEVHGLHFNYGQVNAERERVSARRLANGLGIRLEVVDIAGLKEIFLDKVGEATDYNIGCWEALPFMLGFPIAVAASYGLAIGAEAVLVAIHGTDVEDHPEYRPEALQALEAAVRVATGKGLSIGAPFIGMSKSQLVKVGKKLGVPYELTWSCLLAGLRHCGACVGCLRRKRSFSEAEEADPTLYVRPGDVPIDEQVPSFVSRR